MIINIIQNTCLYNYNFLFFSIKNLIVLENVAKRKKKKKSPSRFLILLSKMARLIIRIGQTSFNYRGCKP